MPPCVQAMTSISLQLDWYTPLDWSCVENITIYFTHNNPTVYLWLVLICRELCDSNNLDQTNVSPTKVNLLLASVTSQFSLVSKALTAAWDHFSYAKWLEIREQFHIWGKLCRIVKMKDHPFKITTTTIIILLIIKIKEKGNNNERKFINSILKVLIFQIKIHHERDIEKLISSGFTMNWLLVLQITAAKNF